MEKSKTISKKMISIVLSLLVVFSCFSGMGLTAHAIYVQQGLEHFIPVLDNGGNLAFYDASIRVNDDLPGRQRTVRLLFSTLTREQITAKPGWSTISSTNTNNNCYLAGDTITPPNGSQINVSDVGIDTQDITYNAPSPAGVHVNNFEFSAVPLDPNTSYYTYFIVRSAMRDSTSDYTVYRMLGDSLGTLTPMKINYNKQKTDGTYDTTVINTHYVSGQYLDVSELGTVPTGYHINTSLSTSSGNWNGTSEINIYYDKAAASLTIGENVTYYDSFDAAVAAVNAATSDCTLTVLKTVDEGKNAAFTNTRDIKITLSVPSGVTLSLKNPGARDNSGTFPMKIEGCKNFHINGEGTIHLKGCYSRRPLWITSGSVVTIEDGIHFTFEDNTYNSGTWIRCIWVDNGSKLDILGGDYTADNSIRNMSTVVCGNSGSVVNIYGGHIGWNPIDQSKAGTLDAFDHGNINVYGGYIDGVLWVANGTPLLEAYSLYGGKFFGDAVARVEYDNQQHFNLKTISEIVGDKLKVKSISEDPYFAEIVSAKCKAISSDENAGTATVDGVAEKNEYFGTEVTFVATPKSGYSFVEWKRGEATVSTDATYKYTPSKTTAGDEEIELTATFEASAAEHGHDGVDYTEWTSADSLPSEAGNYVLTSDVTISAKWTVSTNIRLCLNGHGITKTGNNDNVIRIVSGGNLTIDDCGNTTHYFDVNNGKAANVNATSGTNSFTGGYITGGTGYSYEGSLFWDDGGGIYVDGGTFTLNGGTLLGNSSTWGGGVEIYSGSMTMNGGTICYNTNSQGGGGVAFRTASNQWNRNGTGATTATFVMNGGTVTNNGNGGIATAGFSYGNDYVTINGGTITDNGGWGVYSRNLTITGDVTITGNTNGAGFENTTAEGFDTTCSISGNPVITGNTNSNLYFDDGQVATVGALGANAQIGVTMKTPGVFTSGYSANNSADPETFFTPDEAGTFVELDSSGEAKLVMLTWTASFAAGEGSGTMASVEVQRGKSFNLPTSGFTAPVGKMLGGWSDGTNTYNPGAQVTLNEDTTFTAQWVDGVSADFTLNDSWGDGWNGASLIVREQGSTTPTATLTIGSGSSSSGSLDLPYGKIYELVWMKGRYDSECSFTFTNPYDSSDVFTATGNNCQGYTNGQVLATFYPPKLIAGHTLSLDGNIAINFYLNPAAAGMTANQVTADNLSYSFAWVDQADTKAKVDVAEQARQSQAFTVSDDGKYIIVTCHVCAAEMTCGVNASFTLGEKSESEVYSVRDYCDSVLNPTAEWLAKYKTQYPDNTAKSYDNLVALVKKMLDYGAKAQTVFGIKIGDPANTGLDYTMSSDTPDFDAAIRTANGSTADDLASSDFFGENFKAPSLVFLDYSTLKLYFENKDGSLSTSGLTKWNNYYYIKHENIAASQLDTLQTFTVSGKTFRYSALDYAKVLATSANTDNANLAKAMYWYNQAANAYFG